MARTVQVPAHVDRNYRDGLKALVMQDGGERARWYIGNALSNGPSRGGYAESARYFGKEFDTKLKLTAPVVDACEIAMPGFKEWLVRTGFGNDKTMIRGFVAWAETLNGMARARPQLIDEIRATPH